MNFSGLWQNNTNNELIKLSGPLGSDDYILEYEINFQKSETIQIFKTNQEHALLLNSNKFGKVDIITISVDCIKIGNQVFNRYVEKRS